MKSNQMMLIIGLSVLMIGGVWGIEVITNSGGPKSAEASASESIEVPVINESDAGTSVETIETSNQTEVTAIIEEPVINISEQFDSAVSVVPLEISEVTVKSDSVVQSSVDSYVPVNDDPIVIVSKPYEGSLSSSSDGGGVSSGSESVSSSGGGVSSSAAPSDSSSGGGGGGDSSSGGGGGSDTGTDTSSTPETTTESDLSNSGGGTSYRSSSKVILDELRKLEPLPKVHYSWFLRSDFVKNRTNEFMYELARLTHSLCYDAYYATSDYSIRTGAGKVIIDNMVYTCARINKTEPEIPSRIGITYSPWHKVFMPKVAGQHIHSSYQYKIFYHSSYQDEIDTFVRNMTTVKEWIKQSNNKYGTDVKIGSILLDAERFLRRDNKYPLWNDGMCKALDAIHVEAVKLFPEARIEWYGRGFKRWGSSVWSKWDRTPYFTGDEIMTTVSFSCYRLPDAEHTERIVTENAKYADSLTPIIEDITPWVALACGYDETKWKDDWDYDTAISYKMGAKLNGVAPPYDRVKRVIFFLDPFNPDVPAWGKHFIEYCKGAATASSR